MIEHTKGQVIIATDHSKWGMVSNFQVASLDEIDKLVTDEAFDVSAIESLAAHSVDILIADGNSVQALITIHTVIGNHCPMELRCLSL